MTKSLRFKALRFPILQLIIIILISSCTEKVPDYKNPKSPVEKRVADLIDRMTLEEKILLVTGHEEKISKEVNGGR